ncbi:hypothetical protein V8E36_006779 [Tilletia maclaganii]
MQLAFTGLLVTIMCALGVQAAKDCGNWAAHHCPNNQDPKNAEALTTLGFICLRGYWETLTNNDKCPHPRAGCLCYNGCVKDRSSGGGDVGGFCTAACKRGGQTAPTCQ